MLSKWVSPPLSGINHAKNIQFVHLISMYGQILILWRNRICNLAQVTYSF